MRYLFIIFLLSSAVFASCSDEKAQSSAPIETKKSDFEVLQEQIKNNPKDAEAWYHLADVYERANMHQEEIDALKHVISLKPSMGYAYFKLGTTYNRIERYQDAVANFLKANRYVHNQPMFYNNLAISYGKLGKIDEEIAALKKAVALRPKYAIARFNLGMALLKKSDRTGARSQYDVLKNIDEGLAAALKKEIEARRK